MAETQAAPSPAEVPDVFGGQQPSMGEYSRYRLSGELPERFKPAATEPADAPEETVIATEPTPEEDRPEESRDPKPPTEAEKRIKQLLAEKKELQRKLDAAAPPEPKPEPAKPQGARTKPVPTGNGPDGKPYATYEDYIEDLTDWKGEQKIAQFRQEQQQSQQLSALQVKLTEAQSRYEDADEVIFPTADAIAKAQIPQVIKDVIAQSDVFPDLCYVIGSDPEELKKLVALAKSNPRAALARVFEFERGIGEELVEKVAPEQKRTAAPKPPTPVGGSGSSRAFDVSDESLSPEEWARKRTAALKHSRG